jgi:hypothetical protein
MKINIILEELVGKGKKELHIACKAVKMGRTIGPAIVLYGLGQVGFNKIYLGLIGPGHLSPFICLAPLGRGRAESGWAVPAHLTALISCRE